MKQVTRTQFVSRPRDEDRITRAPLPIWDRIKFFVLLGALFGLFVWSETGDNPILPVSEAVRNVVHNRWWVLALAGVELVRQVHFVIAEHWSAYYFFWQRRFAGDPRVVGRTAKIKGFPFTIIGVAPPDFFP